MSEEALQEVWPSFLQNEKDIKDGTTTSDYNNLKNGSDENEHKNGNAEQDAPASKKYKKEPKSSNECILGIIHDLLNSCPQWEFITQKKTPQFLPELERYTLEHPERFVAGYPSVMPLFSTALAQSQSFTQHLKLN